MTNEEQLEAIETALANVLKTVQPLKTVINHEPAGWLVNKMPIAFFRWTGPNPIVDVETGPGQDVNHQWILELDVNVPPTRQGDLQMGQAQKNLKKVVQAVTAAFRADPTMNNTVDIVRLTLEREADFFKREPMEALLYGLQFRVNAIVTESEA